mgnify:CR=1 FL=1
MEEELEKIAKEIRNKQAREWRAKNKDKVKEINHRYWLKKAREIIERESKDGRN